MNSDAQFWLAIGTALGGGGVLTALVTWILNRRKAHSEIEVDRSEIAKNIAEGGETAVDAMEKVLTRYDKMFEQQAKNYDAVVAENSELKKRVLAVETQRTADLIDEDTKRKRLIARLEAQEQYIKLLVTLLSQYVPAEKIPPMPDVLTESQKMKAIKS